MNKERLKTIAVIIPTIITVFLVLAMIVMIVEDENNKTDFAELEIYYEYCITTLEDVLPENLPENFDEEKVLGCGITTELGMDNKCHPLPQM